MVDAKKPTRLAIIRIRGRVGLHPDLVNAFTIMRLYRKNYCTILSNAQHEFGMANKIKDFSTFGDLDEETFAMLLKERGRLAGNARLTDAYVKEKTGLDIKGFASEFMNFKKELTDIPGLKTFFRLSPPIKGFERKGIKKPFSIGGVLGYRKDKINELIRRML